VARFVRGDLVVVPFPLTGTNPVKNRPALVIASWPYGQSTDYLICLITSQHAPDPSIVPIQPSDVQGGSLSLTSYLRPSYLASVGERHISRRIGTLSTEKVEAAIAVIRQLVS